MNTAFFRNTAVFLVFYAVSLLVVGVLAASVRETTVLQYLRMLWTDPLWLVGVAIGVCLWVGVHVPAVRTA